MADASALKRDRFEVVRAWHEAVNRGDADALVALCDDDIEVGGPRGSARGHAILRDWLERAGIQLEPRRWFASPADLVVEQVAIWRGPDGVASEPQIIASSFTVADGRVMRTVRYGSLEEALAATGLTLADKVLSAAGCVWHQFNRVVLRNLHEASRIPVIAGRRAEYTVKATVSS